MPSADNETCSSKTTPTHHLIDDKYKITVKPIYHNILKYDSPIPIPDENRESKCVQVASDITIYHTGALPNGGLGNITKNMIGKIEELINMHDDIILNYTYHEVTNNYVTLTISNVIPPHWKAHVLPPTTTGALTTGAPTTEAPTTGAPTTSALTTGALTTGALTTGALTTEAPTTGALTTGALTTGALTTGALTTEAPTTGALTTGAPTTGALTTEAPTTGALTTEAPTTGAPTTEAPTTEIPNVPALGTEFTNVDSHKSQIIIYYNLSNVDARLIVSYIIDQLTATDFKFMIETNSPMFKYSLLDYFKSHHVVKFIFIVILIILIIFILSMLDVKKIIN